MHADTTRPPDACRFRLLTLGGLSLSGGDCTPAGAAAQRRPLALLAILAVAGERGVSRERVQTLLWPESDAEHARKVLAQTVYALRRDLGDARAILGTAELRYNPELITSDVAEFEGAIAGGTLERAVALYRGPFLGGVHLGDASEFERWADAERDRLYRRALDALERLARASESRGEWEVAAAWWRRLAVLDPLNGRVAARYMSALASAGDSAGALLHARQHEALVREELDAPVDPVVAALRSQLRTTGRADADARPVATDRTREPHGTARAGEQAARIEAPAPGADVPAAAPRAASQALPGSQQPAGAAPGEASPAPHAGGPGAAPPARRAAHRSWLARGAAMAIVVAAVFRLATSRGASELDRTLVAVVPFDVADRDLRLWREGMVDVLARNLDGAGPLRTLSPTVVIRDWAGRADREAVRTFARAAGAGVAVYGQLLRAGGDSLRVGVTLLDVRTGRSIGEFRRQDAGARMDRLTDSLTLDLLRAIGRVTPIGLARAAQLGGVTSLEALRAFLHGEQFYRRASWDSAVGHYQRAVTVDSGFALAWRRLGLVASWQLLQQDSLVAAYLLRSGAANRGLGPRDSLLVTADSLTAAANTSSSVVEVFASTRRLFGTLDEARRRYPLDPEVWFAIGEARYHIGFGPVVGVDERATLDAFDRAIALDPAFAPSYPHAVELGLNLGGAPLGLRYARAYLARNPTEAAHRGVLLIEPLVDPDRARSGEVERLLDTARTSALVSARTILRRWPDSAETAVRLSRLLAAGRPSEYPLFADTGFMRRRLAEQLAFRGHLAEAAQVLGARDVPLFAELAYLGAIPPRVADTVLGRWARENSPRARLALPYWSTRRDTTAVAAVLAGARRAAQASGAADAQRGRFDARAAYDTASAMAHLALARGDSAGALRRLLVLPDTLCGECYLDRLTRARLLTASGQGRAALDVLREALVAFLTPVEVVFAIERARTATRAGDGRTSAAACGFARAAWLHADPAAKSMVDEVCRAR